MEKVTEKKKHKVIDCQKSNMTLSKKLQTLSKGLIVFVVAIMLFTGCSADLTMDSPILFDGTDLQHASVEDYYYIRNEGKTYYVLKDNVVKAIPSEQYLYDVGLKVDEKGNTIVIPPLEIKKEEDIDVILKNCKKSYEDGEYKVVMGGVDNASLVTGYHIVSDGKTYDLMKSDIVSYFNNNKRIINTEIEYISSNYGGPDSIKFKK